MCMHTLALQRRSQPLFPKQLTLGQVELTIPLTSKGKGVISNVISRYCNFIVLH